MKRMLFASDYDGTLCRRGQIDEDTLAAAARFRARGGLFGVCSGRDPGTLKAELTQHGLDCDFLIMMNGARIEVDGQCLRETPLHGYDRAVPLLQERAQFYTVLGTEQAYLSAGASASDMPPGDRAFVRTICHTHRMMPSPKAIDTVYQISCRTENEQAAVALAKALCQIGLCASPNCEYVDVIPPGVGKAEAVETVRAYYGIAKDAVRTAGDGRNDMEMLSVFSGFAMAQAEECVRQAAGRTVESVGQALEWICGEEKK